MCKEINVNKNHFLKATKEQDSFAYIDKINNNNDNNNKHLYRTNFIWICSNARNKQIWYKLKTS